MPNPFRIALRVLDHTLAAVFPPSCCLCGRACGASSFCEECRDSWAQCLRAPLCDHCGEEVTASIQVCGGCSGKRTQLVSARSLMRLNDGARRLLHRVKFQGQRELLGLAYPYFRNSFEPFFPEDVVVMAVPAHFSRVRHRGFNQAEWLAQWVAEAWGLDVWRGRLVKPRPSPPQSTLGRAARGSNLTGKFSWRGSRPPPERVLLVDDVYTTGATLESCAHVLSSAGAREIYAWTLFRAGSR